MFKVQRKRQRDRDKARDRETETERQIQRQRDRETERQREQEGNEGGTKKERKLHCCGLFKLNLWYTRLGTHHFP